MSNFSFIISLILINFTMKKRNNQVLIWEATEYISIQGIKFYSVTEIHNEHLIIFAFKLLRSFLGISRLCVSEILFSMRVIQRRKFKLISHEQKFQIHFADFWPLVFPNQELNSALHCNIIDSATRFQKIPVLF